MRHLAKLARINITKDEEEKLVSDAEGILRHFEDLAEVDTSNVEPMTGGVNFINKTREDEFDPEISGKGRENFPEMKGDYLKVPAVKGESSNL